LLDENLEANFTALMQFDLWKNMIENETRLKNERVARGVNAAYKKFQYVGGNIPFGYTVDLNNNFQPDPVNSEIVKIIFQLYGSGNYSCSQIGRELINRGLIPLVRKQIENILNNKAYKGEIYKDNYNVNYRLYPAIVTPELFNQCSELLGVRSNKKSDRSKGIYYASRLVKCSKCGTTMVAVNSNNLYVCGLSRHNNDITKGGCFSGDQINLNIVDSLALNEAFIIDVAETFEMDNEKRKEIELKIIELNNKINVCASKLDKLRVIKRKQIKKEFDYLNDKEIEQHLERKIKTEKQNIDNELIEYKFEIERLENSLKSKSKSLYQHIGDNIPTPKVAMEIIKLLTDKQRYDLVHSHIKEITVTTNDKKVKEITIKPFNGSSAVFYYDTTRKNIDKKLFRLTTNGKQQPLAWNKYIIERFKRKDTRKRLK